jgi:hypothetical protein
MSLYVEAIWNSSVFDDNKSESTKIVRSSNNVIASWLCLPNIKIGGTDIAWRSCTDKASLRLVQSQLESWQECLEVIKHYKNLNTHSQFDDYLERQHQNLNDFYLGIVAYCNRFDLDLHIKQD